MKRVLGVMTVVGVLGALGAGAAGASGAGAKSCQAGFTESRSATQLKVSGDTCANARRVAERTTGIAPTGCIKVKSAKKGTIGFRSPCIQLSYSCKAVSLSSGRALRVTCTRGARQIRFRY